MEKGNKIRRVGTCWHGTHGKEVAGSSKLGEAGRVGHRVVVEGREAGHGGGEAEKEKGR